MLPTLNLTTLGGALRYCLKAFNRSWSEDFPLSLAFNNHEKYGDNQRIQSRDKRIVGSYPGSIVKSSFGEHESRLKAVKYSTAFDGTLPCLFEVFTESRYISEDIALPEVVLNHVKQENNHVNIYILDKGLRSTMTMSTFNQEQIRFIVRAAENRKHVEPENLISDDDSTDLGNLVLLKDSCVHLYTSKPIK